MDDMRWLPYLFRVFALAGLCYLGGKLGQALVLPGSSVPLLWPPAGIGLGALLVHGSRLWPGIGIGVFLAHLGPALPAWTLLGLTSGTVCGALVGAVLIRRSLDFQNALDRNRDVLTLLVLGAGAGTILSPSIAVLSLLSGEALPVDHAAMRWVDLWIADALGVLVMTPACLSVAGGPRITWPHARAVEVIALMLTIVLVCGIVFGDWFFRGRYIIPVYVVFPLLLWAPLRLGLCCTTMVTLLVSVGAVWGTARGLGPFSHGSPLENRVLFWLFANIVATTGLILAAATAQRKRAEERIQELALHDPLTGLANRTLLDARFTEILARSHRYGGQAALLYLDLDRFKPVNDTLGHQAGDDVLVEAAKRIEACVREVDTVARVGGDEFVIVLQDAASPAAAESVASKVIAALAWPFRVLGFDWEVGGSIGIAIYPGDGADLVTLMANADIALYRAKQSGGNAYRVYENAP